MRDTSLKSKFFFALLSLLLVPAFAQAQASRTWVSGVGDDANPCSRTAPCKTLAGAISKTAAGGIMNLIDSGGLGAVTITKSITIQMEPALAGILASGTNGIVINAAATDTVVLRGLAIHGFGSGLTGVRILQAGSVRIENCDIQDFLESGIKALNTTALKISVENTSIERILASGGSSNANDGGIVLTPSGAGSVRAVFKNVRIHGANQWGINVLGNLRLSVHDSVISGTTGSAIRIDGSVGAAQVTIDDSSLVDNSVNGILSSGSSAIARVNRSVFTGNSQAMLSASSGQIISFGTNVVAGNAVNGTATGTAALQ